MRYRINQIKVDPYKVAGREGGIDKEVLIKELKAAVDRSINVKKTGVNVTQVEIVKESIDARKKPNVKLIYSVEFTTDKPIDESKLRVQINPVKDRDLESKEDNIPACKNGERPVVVGFGPCGILAGLVLAEVGMNPIIIERGKSVDERVADVESFWARGENPNPESNVQFGEGGAGTFSDGKLVTGIKDKRVRKVFEAFVEAGANPEILYKQKPHIGTDKLRDVVKNLRYRIEELGGQVRFNSKLVGLCIEGNELQGIEVESTSELAGEDREIEVIDTRMVIMAIGHSARDTFSLMHKLGFDMTQKPFSIGVRIEHPQKMVNLAQYGDEKLADILGPADYKLSYRCQDEGKEATYGRGVYTFCMCPGGLVVNASTEKETAVTNGMSNSARDGEYANSALLVDVRTTDFGSDHPLAGLEFQRKYEELAYRNMVRAGGSGLPQTTYGEFKTYALNKGENKRFNPVGESLPAFAVEAMLEAMSTFGHRLKGFDRSDGKMSAVETRSSSPVRITRDENMNAMIGGNPIKGVIPAGEGPGYAGGITSAAVEGIKAAEAVIRMAIMQDNDICL